MDQDQKRTALRMIPYGLYVLTARGADGSIAAATVNWVTQSSFEPPLVVVAVKHESTIHELIQQSQAFVLNVLGRDQAPLAFAFFKPAVVEGATISGQPFRPAESGAPILTDAPAFLECRLVDRLQRGDHTVFLGELVAAGLQQIPDGRPDDATLRLKDLGERIFYGG